MNKISFFLLMASISISCPSISNSTPQPEQGVAIIPIKQQNIPEHMKQEFIKDNEEIRAKDYKEIDNPYAQTLINIRPAARDDQKSYFKSSNLYDTHMKKSISEMKLAFNFKPLFMIPSANIIGYAPSGSYINNDEKAYGWTGVSVFFYAPTIGNCGYSYFDLNISHGAVQLPAESTDYIVNKKPSSSYVEGKEGSGFLYHVEWFEQGKMQWLECANMKFDKQLQSRVIALANQIDKR